MHIEDTLLHMYTIYKIQKANTLVQSYEGTKAVFYPVWGSFLSGRDTCITVY